MQMLHQLGAGDGLPIAAILAATDDRTNMAPLLAEALARHEARDQVEEDGLFIAFHLLGQWREKSAYRDVARFLRRPEADEILGDATTATCHRVMANVFDGDPNPIYEIIRDADADEFVRSRMFDALAMLVLQGELERTEVASFLRAAYGELQPQGEGPVWFGWQTAIAMLALEELEPLVREAFKHGFIDEMVATPADFENDLRRAQAGEPVEEWQREEYSPFGDVIDELSDWTYFSNENAPDRDDGWLPPSAAMPARNPFRDVGRNDPCPCGSGKKFKKCCLGKADAARQVTPADDVGSPAEKLEDDAVLSDYDPLVEPDAATWLAAGEQTRIDVVEHYHRRHGIDLENSTVHAVFHAIVENQIAEGDRWPIRRALLRLMAEGLNRHDAIHAIGSVLASHIHDLFRADKPPPGAEVNEAYFSEVERLTAEDWLNSG
ncbi:DUF1186 domain-containing protein [Bradyrhizobium sp.]|uniref:DUF1186 domain-containing protein n=1 Tax=Bradyrhizobium sp. TaxID=376 RepID=UPI004037DC27